MDDSILISNVLGLVFDIYLRIAISNESAWRELSIDMAIDDSILNSNVLRFIYT